MIAGVVDPDDSIIAFRCSPNETYRKHRTTDADIILTTEGFQLKKLLLAEVDQCNRSTEDQHKIFIFVLILKMKNERQAQANGNDNPLDFDDLDLSLDDLL